MRTSSTKLAGRSIAAKWPPASSSPTCTRCDVATWESEADLTQGRELAENEDRRTGGARGRPMEELHVTMDTVITTLHEAY